MKRRKRRDAEGKVGFRPRTSINPPDFNDSSAPGEGGVLETISDWTTWTSITVDGLGEDFSWQNHWILSSKPPLPPPSQANLKGGARRKTRRERPRRFATGGRIVFLPPADPPVCFLTLVPAGGRVLHNQRAWKMSANTENGRKKLHPTVFHGSAHLWCEFWIPGRSSCSRWLLWPQRVST